jgi:hypothetical protein
MQTRVPKKNMIEYDGNRVEIQQFSSRDVQRPSFPSFIFHLGFECRNLRDHLNIISQLYQSPPWAKNPKPPV